MIKSHFLSNCIIIADIRKISNFGESKKVEG